MVPHLHPHARHDRGFDAIGMSKYTTKYRNLPAIGSYFLDEDLYTMTNTMLHSIQTRQTMGLVTH